MTSSMAIFWFFFLSLSSFSIAQTTPDQGGRAQHGLVYENSVSFSPSAFEFFHSNSPKPDIAIPCVLSDCVSLPQSSVLSTDQSLEADGNKLTSGAQVNNKSRVGAGGVAAIVFGFVLAVLLAMVAFYVMVTRRANVRRANSVQPAA
ncbi:hypothetical protein BVC80_1591g49 [Macleaya cordata]|uniref:Transmembrane protein n=1 Tax=Macleaya cordata TaxID=56857 RepID=A0A200QI08_MACCD|nr:hypothetical protein BVC80_1591g49 [Macleaya cordata]